jgi:hypothetical protein
MSNNEWSRPESPPPPLFLGEKERNLVKQVNDELVEKVIGQQILYYPIDMETTNFHDLYGEAIEKTFFSSFLFARATLFFMVRDIMRL